MFYGKIMSLEESMDRLDLILEESYQCINESNVITEGGMDKIKGALKALKNSMGKLKVRLGGKKEKVDNFELAEKVKNINEGLSKPIIVPHKDPMPDINKVIKIKDTDVFGLVVTKAIKSVSDLTKVPVKYLEDPASIPDSEIAEMCKRFHSISLEQFEDHIYKTLNLDKTNEKLTKFMGVNLEYKKTEYSSSMDFKSMLTDLGKCRLKLIGVFNTLDEHINHIDDVYSRNVIKEGIPDVYLSILYANIVIDRICMKVLMDMDEYVRGHIRAIESAMGVMVKQAK